MFISEDGDKIQHLRFAHVQVALKTQNMHHMFALKMSCVCTSKRSLRSICKLGG